MKDSEYDELTRYKIVVNSVNDACCDLHADKEIKLCFCNKVLNELEDMDLVSRNYKIDMFI